VGDFLRALGDIATNESAYRNAVIAAVVLLFDWELGKWIARRNPRQERPRADAMTAVDAGAGGELQIDLNGR